MRRRFGLLESLLQHRDRLVEILLLCPDRPLKLPLITAFVVLPDLPLALLRRGLVRIQVNPRRLGRETGPVGTRRLDRGARRLGLGESEVTAGIADRAEKVLLLGDGVVVLVGDGDATGGEVGSGSALTRVGARGALGRNLRERQISLTPMSLVATRSTHREELSSLRASLFGTHDLDNVLGIRIGDLVLILDLSDRAVLPRSGEVNAATISQGLSALFSTHAVPVLRWRSWSALPPRPILLAC
jgi:hypothetical protein